MFQRRAKGYGFSTNRIVARTEERAIRLRAKVRVVCFLKDLGLRFHFFQPSSFVFALCNFYQVVVISVIIMLIALILVARTHKSSGFLIFWLTNGADGMSSFITTIWQSFFIWNHFAFNLAPDSTSIVLSRTIKKPTVQQDLQALELLSTSALGHEPKPGFGRY